VCRYADAFSDTFLFFEAQHSGNLSSNVGGNRIKWRGQQLMDDGSDVGLDLSGGMYEAGSTISCELVLHFCIFFDSFTTIMPAVVIIVTCNILSIRYRTVFGTI
jgi:hypothetical protein